MNAFNMIFQERKAFIGYLTAGQNGLDYTTKAAHALAEGGVDILEIGLPFSDPIADGISIQKAMSNALKYNHTLEDILYAIHELKQTLSIPMVIFTYYNLLIHHGLKNILTQAKSAGVDAFLIVDLPFEEADEYFYYCIQCNIEPIALLSPSTKLQRAACISQYCNSFIYYVCRNGTTGIKSTLPNDFIDNITAFKSLIQTPIVTGFGISNRTLAAKAIMHADGFVVGSAFVEAISQGASTKDLRNLALNIDPRVAK